MVEQAYKETAKTVCYNVANKVLPMDQLPDGLKEAYEGMDSDVLDHGFESLNRILADGSTVFRGVYPGQNNDLRAYTMVSALDPPATRLKELAKIAGVD